MHNAPFKQKRRSLRRGVGVFSCVVGICELPRYIEEIGEYIESDFITG